MTRFSDWLLQRESSAATRARAAAANGLMPMAVVGSPNGHSTASPFETKQIKKAVKDSEAQNKKHHGATKNKKKVSNTNQNTKIDSWVQEVDDLKDSLSTLKAVFDKKKEFSKKSADKDRSNKKLPQPTNDPEPHDPKKVAAQKTSGSKPDFDEDEDSKDTKPNSKSKLDLKKRSDKNKSTT